MKAPISVIIPTLNCADRIRPTIASLFEGLDAGLICELIISDGESSDDIEMFAEELGAAFISSPAGRGRQLRRGAVVAKGDWLLFLHADTVLIDGWSKEVLRFITSGQDRAAVFRLTFDAYGLAPRFVANWANFRTRYLGLPYGDQGLLISHNLYESVGGFPDIPLMEDVAMARSLRGKIALLTCRVQTSAEKYEQQGWLRRGSKNLLLLARYFLGTSPDKLALSYKDRKAD